jgi:hypothetical protein
VNHLAFWCTWCLGMGILLPQAFRLGYRMGLAGVPVWHMHVRVLCWSVFFVLVIVGVATLVGRWAA